MSYLIDIINTDNEPNLINDILSHNSNELIFKPMLTILFYILMPSLFYLMTKYVESNNKRRKPAKKQNRIIYLNK
jgi:RsiW-degrading membrane proteinase PrsW (M82 family)